MAVEFDKDYIGSWDGVIELANMQAVVNDKGSSDVEKAMAFGRFVSKAVKNIDDVKAECGGENAPFDKVAEVILNALAESQLKN